MDKFSPSQELVQQSYHNCTEVTEDSVKMCQDIFYLLNGYNFQNINKVCKRLKKLFEKNNVSLYFLDNRKRYDAHPQRVDINKSNKELRPIYFNW